MKRNIIGLCALSSAILFSPYVLAEQKVGVVDVQKILDTVEEGKKAKSQFEQEMLAKKGDLDKKQIEFKKLEDNLEKQKSLLSPSALDQKRKELDNKKMEFQKDVLQAQGDMAKRERQLSDDILKKIKGIVEKIGRDGGFDLIWERNEGGLVYFKPGYDLTNEVIAAYDKSSKK